MSDKTVCQHLNVYRLSEGESPDRRLLDEWMCDACWGKFSPSELQPGRIQVMEPRATLRDQFAMSALTGLLTTVTSPMRKAECAGASKLAYGIADAMILEREKR